MVKIHANVKSDTIQVCSKPEVFSVFLFLAFLAGLCALPFTEYRKDFIAYICMVFPMGITAYYFVVGVQTVRFEQKARVRVRKGFKSWSIPFESISGGYTSHKEAVSRSSLLRTHYLSFELKVDLPDNGDHWIRNGAANIFHYGFGEWGGAEERIQERFHEILAEKGIPDLTEKQGKGGS